jgi:plastocyanin
MKQISNVLSILLIVSSLFIGDVDAGNSTTYLSLVDGYNGFNRITSSVGEPPLYENHTFNINVGESITWVNNDPSDKITIISEQGLWQNDYVVLSHAGRRFSYTFNSSGIYTFSIKEYKRFPEQKIIVSGLVNNTNTGTVENMTNVGANDTIDDKTDNISDIANDKTDNISDITNDKTGNITNDKTGNITNGKTGNISDITNGTSNTTRKKINSGNLPISPIFLPLNILNNLKLAGIAAFVIIVITSLIKD